jgi:rhodanese-related sulfurtransferase
MIGRVSLVAALALLLSACAEPPYTNIDNATLQRLIDDGVPVYDIRRADEWRVTGTVEGSRRLTFVDGLGRLQPGFIETLTREVAPDEPLVLICETGGRTAALAQHLAEQMGYTQVYNVRDGITRWIREGRPVDHG